jgi:DNA polymerase-3 subunit epsilon
VSAFPSRVLGLDFETSGTNVHEDQIVTACAVLVEDGQVVHTREWLVAVDIEISEGATTVHGISTAYAREHGMASDAAVKEIAGAVRYAVASGIATVGFNVCFDLSMLNAECVRRGLGTLEEFCGQPVAPVLDGLVLDKAADRFRPGSRKLTDVATLYGVELKDAHNAVADAIASVEVARAILERARSPYAEVAAMYGDRKYPGSVARAFQSLAVPLTELHTRQIGWYREQAEGLGDWWTRKRAELLADVGLDNPPSVESLPDAGPDERREVLRQQADELATKVASLQFSWPIAEVE